MYQNNQNGRSMIEMIGVLTIIGILTTGGFNLVMKARLHQTTNEVIDTATSLAQKTRHIIRDFVLDGDSDLQAYVIEAKAYPDVLEDGWTDRNDVTYSVTYVGGSPMFWVVASNLSEETCLHMSNGSYGTISSNGFVGLSYDGNEIHSQTPIPLATAVDNCSDGASIYLGFR